MKTLNELEEDLKIYSFLNFTVLSTVEKDIVFEIRNREEVRKWMYNPAPIKYQQHMSFFDSLLQDETKLFYLVKRAGEIIGVYSLTNIKNGVAEGGFYLSPQGQLKCLSVEFCYAVFNYIFNSTDINKICGWARADNRSANSLNTLFGFSQLKTFKIIDGIESEYVYGEITKEYFLSEIRMRPRILKLVNFTLNNATKL